MALKLFDLGSQHIVDADPLPPQFVSAHSSPVSFLQGLLNGINTPF